MSARNGTAVAADEHALDVVASDAEDTTDLCREGTARRAAERNERALDAAVRRVAEQARARRPGHDPSIRITRVDPSSLEHAPLTDNSECADCGLAFRPGDGRRRDADRNGALVHTTGGCDRALRAAARTGEPSPQREQPPVNAPAAPAPASDAEERLVGAWRDQAVVEWLQAEGPKTAREIARQFAIKQPQDIIARLRTRGLIEKTGVKRLAAGTKGGRPGAEYRAIDGQAETPHPVKQPTVAVMGSSEPADELELAARATRDTPAAASDTKVEPDNSNDRADDTAPAGTTTVYEQLAVRYLSALITSIERASILRNETPPAHVFDRIERLLQLQDGPA
jgi:hypothetical protein